MRELKFRAWDTERKTYDHEELLLAPNGDILASRWQELCEPESVYIVEQYTGLKDQNGKEIYEGDIVRYVSEGEDIYLAVIKRKDEDKEQSYWLTGFAYEPFATVDEEELTEEEYESLGGMEIIGNIHENQELLEEE